MDSETSTRHNTNLLERMLLDENAEPTHLPLSILEDITNGFSDDQEIGRGGFAVVYKGIVGKGMVAVKKLSRTFDLPEHKFHREVECLMKVKHKNIVRFLGYCSETHGRTADNEGKFIMADIRNWLLCFEYVPNGSLDKYITDASRGLEWRERYEIIKGICKGLLHLHKKRILHSDLKPGNILVDDQMVPKIVDFGLSRCLDKEQTRAFTSNLRGSLGYLAPEFFSGQVAFASDIYSLGVIIVEILTGEKGYPEDKDVVEAWMNRLEGSDQWEIQLEQVRVCIKIGKECMDSDPKKRPIACRINGRLDKMASVVKTGINSSSAEEQVSFLEGQYGQEKIAKLSSEYLGKDFKEWAKIEELGEFVGTPREDHWRLGREEAPGDPWSLWGAQDTKQNVIPDGASICTFYSSLLYKLSNLDMFNIKARMNYMRYGGPIINYMKSVKLFKRWELKPFLEDQNLIGKDGFGEVYLGIHDGVPFVVRKLISGIGLENGEFACDVAYQSQLVHKNIIRFIGCCVEFDVPMLVLEFLSKGSLNEILHGNKRVPINLAVRLSIAAGLAVSIACLHSHGGMKTFVKPANILLDDDFVPKISNFGTSKFIARDCKDTRTLIDDMYYLDDLAYVDPVYLERGLLTDKSDVYSFGVVLLELLTREKATYGDNNNLVSNFLENHKQGRKSTELFDKEIAVAGDLELLDNLAEIAVKCLNLENPYRRPGIKEVGRHIALIQSRRL